MDAQLIPVKEVCQDILNQSPTGKKVIPAKSLFPVDLVLCQPQPCSHSTLTELSSVMVAQLSQPRISVFSCLHASTCSHWEVPSSSRTTRAATLIYLCTCLGKPEPPSHLHYLQTGPASVNVLIDPKTCAHTPEPRIHHNPSATPPPRFAWLEFGAIPCDQCPNLALSANETLNKLLLVQVQEETQNYSSNKKKHSTLCVIQICTCSSCNTQRR